LSIGYYSPGWPVTAFANGIVGYVAALAPTLKAMGLQVTILAGEVAGSQATTLRVPRDARPAVDESVYDIQQARASRSMPRRAVDGLWYRVAPQSALKYINRLCLLTTVRRAVAERGIQIFEMEETFGWARWVCEVSSIPVCVRLHGPWFLNGPALGVPELERRPMVRLWTTRTCEPYPNSASTRCEPPKYAPSCDYHPLLRAH
jgi:hypothetical protein